MNENFKKLEQSDKENQYDFDFENALIEHSAEILVNKLKGNTVLELGCGKGHISKKIMEANNDLTIVEASNYFIEKTRKVLPKAHFVNAYWEEYDYSSKSFSDIILSRALSSIVNPVHLLGKIKNEAKNKPFVHLVITNTDSFHRVLGEKLTIDTLESDTERAQQVGRIQQLNLSKIETILEDLGYTIIDKQGIGFKPLPNNMMDTLDKKIQLSFSQMGDLAIAYAAEIYILAQCK